MTTRSLSRIAGEVMSTPVVAVRDTDSLEQAARIMIERNIGCLPVIDSQDEFVGMVTERSFQAGLAGIRPASSLPFHERVLQELYISGSDDLSAAVRGFDRARVGLVAHAMVKDEPTVTETTQLWKVAEVMLDAGISHIAVLRGRKAVGIVARHDLLSAYARG